MPTPLPAVPGHRQGAPVEAREDRSPFARGEEPRSRRPPAGAHRRPWEPELVFVPGLGDRPSRSHRRDQGGGAAGAASVVGHLHHRRSQVPPLAQEHVLHRALGISGQQKGLLPKGDPGHDGEVVQADVRPSEAGPPAGKGVEELQRHPSPQLRKGRARLHRDHVRAAGPGLSGECMQRRTHRRDRGQPEGAHRDPVQHRRRAAVVVQVRMGDHQVRERADPAPGQVSEDQARPRISVPRASAGVHQQPLAIRQFHQDGVPLSDGQERGPYARRRPGGEAHQRHHRRRPQQHARRPGGRPPQEGEDGGDRGQRVGGGRGAKGQHGHASRASHPPHQGETGTHREAGQGHRRGGGALVDRQQGTPEEGGRHRQRPQEQDRRRVDQDRRDRDRPETSGHDGGGGQGGRHRGQGGGAEPAPDGTTPHRGVPGQAGEQPHQGRYRGERELEGGIPQGGRVQDQDHTRGDGQDLPGIGGAPRRAGEAHEGHGGGGPAGGDGEPGQRRVQEGGRDGDQPGDGLPGDHVQEIGPAPGQQIQGSPGDARRGDRQQRDVQAADGYEVGHPRPQEGVRIGAGETGAVADGHGEKVARRVPEPIVGQPEGDSAPQRRQWAGPGAGVSVEDVGGLPHHRRVGDDATAPGVRRRVDLPRNAAVGGDPEPGAAMDDVSPVQGLRTLGHQERDPRPHGAPRSVPGHAVAPRHEPLAAFGSRDAVGQRHEPRERRLARRKRAERCDARRRHPGPRRPSGREGEEHEADPHHARRRRQEDQGRRRRGQDRARGGG